MEACIGERFQCPLNKSRFAVLNIVVTDDLEGAIDSWILHTPFGRVRVWVRCLWHDLRAGKLVLIDNQGAVGPLQGTGALAADLLLSPTPPEVQMAHKFARGAIDALDARTLRCAGASARHS